MTRHPSQEEAMTLAEIKSRVEAATSGSDPWQITHAHGVTIVTPTTADDRDFIAACSPSTIKSLLALVEERDKRIIEISEASCRAGEKCFALVMAERTRAEAAEAQVKRLREALAKEPTAQEIQCCCLAYGGGSFTEPMRAALKNFLEARAALAPSEPDEK